MMTFQALSFELSQKVLLGFKHITHHMPDLIQRANSLGQVTFGGYLAAYKRSLFAQVTDGILHFVFYIALPTDCGGDLYPQW